MLGSHSRTACSWVTLRSGKDIVNRGSKRSGTPAFTCHSSVAGRYSREPTLPAHLMRLSADDMRSAACPALPPVPSNSASSDAPVPLDRTGNPLRNHMTTSYTTRGHQSRASTALHSQADLLRSLDADVCAASTLETKTSQFRTWSTFHYRWFGSCPPVLPSSSHGVSHTVT